VLNISGITGQIVDIFWDPSEKSEPDRIIRYAKNYCKECGLVKLTCWGTSQKLRKSLKKSLFFKRSETPRFSLYTTAYKISELSDGSRFHFVHGDGDTEYLA
jgi:hypothetical protein